MKRLLCMSACVHACVRLSHFYIKLYISFSYEDILTILAENVYGCENMFVKNYGTHFKKQYGRHSRLLENH